MLPHAAFKALRVSGSFGGSDLKLGGKCVEHSVGLKFRVEVKQPESSELTTQQGLPISMIE